jgi:L-lactate dehydrogenase complex protein LldG
MERTVFLERLRTRLQVGAPANVAHPLVPVAGVPPVRYDQDLDDPIAAFMRNAAMQGAHVRTVDEPDAFVSSVVAEVGARSVVVSRDPETDGIDDVLRAAGVDVVAFDGPHPEADFGIAGAVWGIAATGTVVFDAGRAGGRSASLLPPAILVLLRQSTIVREAGEIFRHLADRFPQGVPSQLVLCTGPSKSGDIELELTTGVHGPGRVWIGLLPG